MENTIVEENHHRKGEETQGGEELLQIFFRSRELPVVQGIQSFRRRNKSYVISSCRCASLFLVLGRCVQGLLSLLGDRVSCSSGLQQWILDFWKVGVLNLKMQMLRSILQKVCLCLLEVYRLMNKRSSGIWKLNMFKYFFIFFVVLNMK
ncbi:uncharacterized protein LOC113307745 [Papaver somniferum]|uniref:uncharacterized protein LOC113307745 n=1 Tax=Papaver somniferum TaxID=3469 RepID=UPI000E6F8D4F|nr:uncharacterized protein LOC113307745 [Papaver somniferum]XP_026411975.1 uncharacterized protein LOC113307745 [Papaver somniferum]